VFKYLLIIFVLFINTLYANETKINFTSQEKEYLKQNTFTYAGDPNWLPFEAFNKQNKYIGIISEHIDIIEQKLDIKFKKIITKDWLETLELSKNTEADIISGDAADIVLAKNYKPIDTYIQNPLVIVTRDDHPFVTNLNHLKDKKIAFANGGGYSADILKKYPDIKFIKTDTIHTGLLGVKSGKYDIFIGTLAMTDYSIIQMGIEGIKIAGDTSITMNLTLFINNEKPLLHSIINKTMNSIDETQKHNIISKWRHNTIEKVVVDYTLVWKIVGVSIFLLLIGFLFVITLRNNNKKLNQLLNSTIEAVSIFENGKLIDGNKQFLEMYGYNSIKDIKGNSPLDFVSPAQHEFVKSKLKNSQEPYELDMIKANGEIFPSLVRETQIDKNIRITSVMDLTELKETHKKLNELNQTLEFKVKDEVEKNRQKDKLMLHQSRLAQMGEIISMIAHQWRQPLNSLSMLNQSIILKYNKDKLDKEYFEYFKINSKKQIQNMSKTIDDFRDFFKPEKEKTEFCINDTIDNTLDILKPILTKNHIKIIFENKEDFIITGYSNELGQAILNIVNNAKDALVANDICDKSNSTSCHDNKQINITLTKNDENITLTISDNAGGIPYNIIDKIFDPYFSTKDEKNGTGLGLYMSKIIIEDHMDGTFTVSNSTASPQIGAIFKIELKQSKNNA